MSETFTKKQTDVPGPASELYETLTKVVAKLRLEKTVQPKTAKDNDELINLQRNKLANAKSQ